MKRQKNPAGWYKDAVIYQLHVKAFYDSSGDGIGDFPGLTSRLDYIASLGVDTLWLLPFYPSPLRDDGYDIADYRGVHPLYGTMRDFRAFVRAAHERGLRVITELVVNHTSDQHPWFQRARRAARGSVYRDFYVWSDDDNKYAGTRIIFTDTETSNWTWDPLAKQYYWHRFFSHQPDLNFENPRVFEAIADVMRYWFDAGVDGMRLDAVPYLCEREGTNNENLPETHAVIKRLRAIVDAEYPDRFLLAEANQWPEDVNAYFGQGDECHMAFHFPLMPRMFMAIASEDRYPIYDIMRQTPPIPQSCQWAIFLRNHDEMTLEMVTDRERAFMYSVYATDVRARVNVGIRRRLAPLMENDRRKIELMTGLLFSMPGTPIVYYGDEIGMGDNIYLGDRDGVRTPMQWSMDRNGGFSRADAQRLYLPVIQDPVYGYQGVNVEAQQRSDSSLLNWVKRLIAVRQSRKIFGRGSLKFLYPENRKVLAYLREYEDETVLCVANLASTPQAVQLDLSSFAGCVPIELLGWSEFPGIQTDSYTLTMPRYAFYWFLLSKEALQKPEIAVPMPEFYTLVLPSGAGSLMRDPARTTLERDVLPAYLPSRRWFASKDAGVASAKLLDLVWLDGGAEPPLLLLSEVRLRSGVSENYQFTLALAFEHGGEYEPLPAANAFARARKGPHEGLVYDGSSQDRLWQALANAIRENAVLRAEYGSVQAHSSGDLANLSPPLDLTQIRRSQAEQSNTSAIIGGAMMLKLYRRLQAGIHPEIEMSDYLARAGFANTPKLLGSVVYKRPDGTPTALAVAHEYVLNQGDGWSMTLTFLKRLLQDRRENRGETAAPLPRDQRSVYVGVYDHYALAVGKRLAQMHNVLARAGEDPAFAPEDLTTAEVQAAAEEIAASAQAALSALEAAMPNAASPVQRDIRTLLERRSALLERIGGLAQNVRPGKKTRIHGDFHMGQVLVVERDVLIVDLEGETQRPLEERRRKQSPLRDVAGMLRSFDYAAVASLFAAAAERKGDLPELEAELARWKVRAARKFLQSYERTLGIEIDRSLLELFIIAKAVYELEYELANRPAWLQIPVRGLLSIVEGTQTL